MINKGDLRMHPHDFWSFKQDKARLIAFVSREIRIFLVAAVVVLGFLLR